MKINKILFVATIFIALSSNAQITKGNWMMGGGASFGNFKTTNGDSSGNSTNISLFPNIGYFLIDKLSIGTSGQYTYIFEKGDEKTYNSNSIAPFIRYYFLNNEKTINVFSEASYQIMRMSHSDLKADKFKFKAGTVFFVNSVVGIEIALNYSNQKTNQNFENRAIYLDVGFQIHLERK
jgi:hypothetical protein